MTCSDRPLSGGMAMSRFWRMVKGLYNVGEPVWRVRLGDRTLVGHMGSLAWRFGLIPRKLALQFGCTMVFPRGYRAILDYADGTYAPERRVMVLMSRLVRPGMTVVDVGAHLGYYTLLLRKLVGGVGRVYAFEPSPVFYETLKTNLAMNGFVDVVAVPMAVADFCGYQDFHHSVVGGGSSLYRRLEGSTVVKVQVTTLDAFFGELGWPKVDLIKIDIEGAEAAALRGAKELIRRSAPLHLILELNPQTLEAATVSPLDLVLLIRELGFEHIRVVERDLYPLSIGDVEQLVKGLRPEGHVNLWCEKS